MARVAVIQHRIIPGGRLSVLISLIKLLNERGIEPTIITNQIPSREEITRIYGRHARYTVSKLRAPLLPTDLDLTLFHWRIRRRLGDYDLIINNSNSNILLSTVPTTVLIGYFPRRRRAEADTASIHFPEKTWRSADPRWLYRRLLRQLYRREQLGQNTYVVAISKFVKEAIQADFDVSDQRLTVVYPPVDVEIYSTNSASRERQLATLGRFKSYKRNLQQLEIARSVRELDFVIMGFVTSRSYFRQCLNYRDKHQVTNARLLANAPFNVVQQQLSTSRFFMHNVVNEPFGITTVQAIAAGCIPLVHDSGGQREVVPETSLRFTTREDAVTKLKDLLQREDLEQFQVPLMEHVHASFSEAVYRVHMGQILDSKL